MNYRGLIKINVLSGSWLVWKILQLNNLSPSSICSFYTMAVEDKKNKSIFDREKSWEYEDSEDGHFKLQDILIFLDDQDKSLSLTNLLQTIIDNIKLSNFLWSIKGTTSSAISSIDSCSK